MANWRAKCTIRSRCRLPCSQSPPTRVTSASLSHTPIVTRSMAQRTSQARLTPIQRSFPQSSGWISQSDIPRRKSTRSRRRTRRKRVKRSREKWPWWTTRWENSQMWDGHRLSCLRIPCFKDSTREKGQTSSIEQLQLITMPWITTKLSRHVIMMMTVNSQWL